MATEEDNKALVTRFYEEIDKGNIDAMDELVAEDYINHDPPPFPGLAPGREGVKQAFRMFAEGTPEQVLHASTVSAAFGLPVRILPHPDHGRPMVMPG